MTYLVNLKKGRKKLVEDLANIFDFDYYIEQVGDHIDKKSIIDHYLDKGWSLGYDPVKWFSVKYYLTMYEDVFNSNIDPFVHYLQTGKNEGRVAIYSQTPFLDSEEFLHQLSVVKANLDHDFYLSKYDDVYESGMDPAVHYIVFGTAEGRDPNPWFSTIQYLSANTDVRKAKVNPFYHYIQQGKNEGRILSAQNEAIVSADLVDEPAIDYSQIIESLNEEFDRDYYLAKYPDVAQSGLDPLVHFVSSGWIERRDPSTEFSTEYYLDSNPDVLQAGMNPFFHYIIAGRSEGRLPKFPGGYRVEQLDKAIAPSVLEEIWSRHRPKRQRISGEKLRAILVSKQTAFKCVIVSFSHDAYTKNVGGVQLCLATEARCANERGLIHLNLSPASASPRLNYAENTDEFEFDITIDNEFFGCLDFAALKKELDRLGKQQPKKILVIHALHGHNIDCILQSERILKPERCLFWVHDFFSMCEGYNLLRNGVVDCGAPQTTSNACTLCIYGKDRTAHLKEITRLFNAIDFTIVCPSEYARDRWLDANKNVALPFNSIHVRPHVKPFERVVPKTKKQGKKIRIAYLGYPSYHKGWPVFEGIFNKLSKDDRFEFFVLGSTDPLDKRIAYVSVSATAVGHNSMVDTLKSCGIDYALLPSLCPETFGFTTIEAMIAGATIVAMNTSGNIAQSVKNNDAGFVFSSIDEIYNFFLQNAIIGKPRKYISTSKVEISNMSLEIF